MFSFFSMNAFDLLLWAVLLLLVLRALDDQRFWIWVGLVAGVGLLNKVSVLFLLAALAVSLVAARRWEVLGRGRLWLGLAVAVILFAPHLVWQVRHGWPTLEFIRRATALKNAPMTPWAFLGAQVELVNPVAVPLMLVGLAALFRRRHPLAWIYPALLLLFLGAGNAKPYYLGPIYPLLAAAGAVALEGSSGWRRWALPAYGALIAISGLAIMPLARPVLSEDRYLAYAAALGQHPRVEERAAVGRLPQNFADRHGWPELAQTVARVYQGLPAEQRAVACIFAQNYGEAGAVDLYGPALGLPPALSGHNAYWMWGPGPCSGQIMIVVGGRPAEHARAYAEVTSAGTFTCPDCMPYESDLTIWVLRRPRQSIATLWPLAKHFN
jgi:uncharacterized protein (TIGR03382 family)